MVVELKDGVAFKVVVEEFVAALVVAIDGKYQFGFAVVIVISGIDQPHPLAEKHCFAARSHGEPLAPAVAKTAGLLYALLTFLTVNHWAPAPSKGSCGCATC